MDTSKPRLDRRIVRSRNAILSAFERLLMEKPLADITVSAIAREANVDRKTFYVHFGTVDGLLDAIAVDVVEMIVDSVEKTLASMDGDTNERALGAAATFFKTVNEALCNNLVLNRQLIENIPLDDFMARLRAPLEHEIAERDLLPQGLKDEMFDYYLAFLLSGIIGIYRTWALSDGSVPIERVSEVANDLTLNGLSSLESRLDLAQARVREALVGVQPDRPGDEHPAEAVDDRAQVDLLAARESELGDVGEPQQVGLVGVEIPVYEVLRRLVDLAGVGAVA